MIMIVRCPQCHGFDSTVLAQEYPFMLWMCKFCGFVSLPFEFIIEMNEEGIIIFADDLFYIEGEEN